MKTLYHNSVSNKPRAPKRSHGKVKVLDDPIHLPKATRPSRFATISTGGKGKETHSLQARVGSVQTSDDTIIKLLEACNIAMFPRENTRARGVGKANETARSAIEQNSGEGLLVDHRVSTVHVFTQRDALERETHRQGPTLLTDGMEYGRLFPPELLKTIFCGQTGRKPPPIPIPKRATVSF